jgi:23S rRNA (pseudouridine1915-N3)-methyltransferase
LELGISLEFGIWCLEFPLGLGIFPAVPATLHFMQRLTLLTVGPLKTSWLAEGCEDYARRIRPSAKFELIEVPAGKQKDPEKQRDEEGEKLLKAIDRLDGDVWLLDEKGERMASHEFAFLLSQAKDTGRPLTFILGGAFGLSPAVRTKVKARVRLSDMTFPHELCRLVFLEQLYRGLEIGRGSGYHHG